MPKSLCTLLALPGLLLLAALADLGHAQEKEKSSGPDNLHALDLRSRKADEEEFSEKTKKFGVEVYRDDKNGNGLYLSEAGSIAAVAKGLFKGDEGKAKEPKWQHGLKVSVRPAGVKEFDKGKKFGVEVFRDENNGNLVYITENAQIDAIPAKYATPTPDGKPKNPVWKHAMDLKVRKAGEKDFTKDTKKVGVEVYSDENNGNLVYISETGSLAVVSAKLSEGDTKGKDPVWKHGMEIQVRKAGEKEFTKDTRKFGIEVFVDGNNGNQIYVSETGDIAVVPAKWAAPTPAESKGPEFKHAMELAVRKAGEKDFAKDAKKYGIEAYSDENNGNLIYIAETGDLTVVSPKAE